MTADGDVDALLDACGDLIEWSQAAGLRGNYPNLWRQHDTLRRRAHRVPSPATIVKKLLRTEVDVWVETIRSSLAPEVVRDLVEALAANGSSVWIRLDQDRDSSGPDIYGRRERSCRAALVATAGRFRSTPCAARITEMLRCIDGVVEARSDGGFVDPDALEEELRRLAVAIRGHLPPVAREVLGLLAERRADDLAGSAFEMRDDRGERRVPSWELLHVGGIAEPAGELFLPDLQPAYEKLRLGREVEQAHGEAVAENARQTRERQEAERRLEEEERRRQEELQSRQEEERQRQEQQERRVARERAEQQAAQEAERARERDREFMRALDSVYEQAVRNVKTRLAVKNLTLKGVVESQRNRMIREEQDRLLAQIT